ncbi:hypothetical protein BJY01DRAFT_230607 [Aspergillus pseudoustus]|uniref:Uncharacterized protein n=1 Tax=Aspergillus pseudoustus TaxID=1810923 RepID=A0ABR4I7X4_9EURO
MYSGSGNVGMEQVHGIRMLMIWNISGLLIVHRTFWVNSTYYSVLIQVSFGKMDTSSRY